MKNWNKQVMTVQHTTSQVDAHLANQARKFVVPGKEQAMARANVYALVSSFLAGTANHDLCDLVAQTRIQNQSFKRLQIACSKSDLSKLDDEYHALFVGVNRGELLPYASWYINGFLMEQALLDLRKDMEILGFSTKPEQAIPEDHIAAIFEIMRLLLLDDEVTHAKQKEFFNKHIYSWAGKFFLDLSDAKHAVFYRLVADFGLWFIKFENEYFALKE